MTEDRGFGLRFEFRDGVERRVETRAGESVLGAALRADVALVHQCEQGSCGTCIAHLVTGGTATLPGRALALLPGEIHAGYRLTCSVTPTADCAFALDYPSTVLDAPAPAQLGARVSSIEWVAASVAQLDLTLDEPADFTFASGQYARLRVPGSDLWRSYSMASPPKALPRLRFLIRRIENGALSSWLAHGCAAGEPVEIEGPLGSFGLASAKGPILMIAGGTGLAPMMAILETVRTRPGPKPPMLLCFGCTRESDLFYLDEIETRRFWLPTLETRIALMEPPLSGFSGRIGTVVSLLEPADIARSGLTAYLCGPPAMIEAARGRLLQGGVAEGSIHAEQFRSS